MGFKIDYYKELTYQDIRGMSEEKLKITLQNISMHVNSRISQLKRSGMLGYSKAYSVLMERTGGEKLTSKGDKDRNELMKSIKWGINYLNSETGTVSGARWYKWKIETILDIDEDDIEAQQRLYNLINQPNFWELYRKLEEDVGAYYNSEDIVQAVYDELEQMSRDETKLERLERLMNIEAEKLPDTKEYDRILAKFYEGDYI